MTRINTNVGALIAQTNLQRSQSDMQTALQRLSSGLRINRGADDPAGLIASESLRAEMAGIGKAISNSERASNVIATAEGALNEVANMLVNIQQLTVEAANSGALSQEEIEANQLQVDSAIESITRIANTTTFAGLKLLDGSLSYVTSGVDETKIKDLHVYSVQFGDNAYIPVKVNVVTSAQKAALQYKASQTSKAVTIEIKGNIGTTTISFGSGTTASAIAFAVNTYSDATGVTARLTNGTSNASGVTFESTNYGSNAFVQVQALLPTTNPFDVYSGTNKVTRDTGRDIGATINGIRATGDGLNINLQSLGLEMEMTVDSSFKSGSASFAITGGGAKFQLGPAVNTNQQVNIGIRSVAASSLGNGTDGYLTQIVKGGAYSLTSGNAAQASNIIQAAIKQISVLRGRLGAFEKNVLQTNINSLQITLENVTASESQIRDADFAEETSKLTRAQILNQAGMSVLSMANQTPQSVLTLLGGG